jgi:hypothetical protein
MAQFQGRCFESFFFVVRPCTLCAKHLFFFFQKWFDRVEAREAVQASFTVP